MIKNQKEQNALLTEEKNCGIIPIITFEQEPVTKIPGGRELSVGARQWLGVGEFLLRVAD